MSNKKPSKYGIGPFLVDDDQKTVTLAPGMYEITQPIVFGMTEETKVTGVNFQGLTHRKANSATGDHIPAQDVAA